MTKSLGFNKAAFRARKSHFTNFFGPFRVCDTTTGLSLLRVDVQTARVTKAQTVRRSLAQDGQILEIYAAVTTATTTVYASCHDGSL